MISMLYFRHMLKLMYNVDFLFTYRISYRYLCKMSLFVMNLQIDLRKMCATFWGGEEVA